jgi:PEP-CTERM motif
MRKVILHFVLAAPVISALSAAPIVQSIGGTTAGCGVSAGLCSSLAGATTVSFDGLSSGITSYQSGIATYNWGAASSSPFVSGPNVDSQYAAPPDDSTGYLAVGSGAGRPATLDISFSQPVRYFGFYMGSPDAYNHVTFTQESGALTTYSGASLFLPSLIQADGNQQMGFYLNFTSTDAFTNIRFLSTTPAFETDNHAFGNAVPEPSTYALLGAGFVALGALRSRQRRNG